MSTEKEELLRYEAQDPQRPDLRFRVWTGTAERPLAGSMTNELLENGESVCRWDLGSHDWVIRVEVDFDKAPGLYRIEYCCDEEGQGAEEWIFLAAGQAERVLGTVDSKYSQSRSEETRQKYHAQPPLFMRYLRVVVEADAVRGQISAAAWRVWGDGYLDLTDRLVGSLIVSRKTEAHKLGSFVRPTLEVELADDDGMLRLKAPPSPPAEETPLNPPVNGGTSYFDENGLSRLKAYARGTLDIRYFGPNWEVPVGPFGDGWWPRFNGERLSYRRPENVEAGGARTVVGLRFEGGTVLRGKTSQPLEEQIGIQEYLRDRLTVSDDGLARLIGVRPDRNGRWVETSWEEYVGRTWAFGDNWRELVLSIDANQERIQAICTTGTHLIAVMVDNDAVNQHWWLVRFDFGGREIERVGLGPEWFRGFWNGRDVTWYQPWTDVEWDPQHRETILTRNVRTEGVDLCAIHRLADGNWAEAAQWLTEGSGAGISAGGGSINGYCQIKGGRWDGGSCIYLGPMTTPTIWTTGGGVKKHRFRASFQKFSGEWGWLWEFPGAPEYGAFSIGSEWSPEPRCLKQIALWREPETYRYHYLLALSGGAVENRAGGVVPDVWARGDKVRFIEIVTSHKSQDDLVIFSVTELPCRAVGGDLRSLVAQGDYILGAGFGPDGVQGVAKVARLGWYLENALIYSESTPSIPSVNGGVRAVNFGEARIRVGGEILSAADYELDCSTGHLRMKVLPENGLEIRASYDYAPTFGLVAVKKEERWEVAQKAANAFGLVLRVDELGRLAWRRRWIVERFAAEVWDRAWRMPTANRYVWVLGQSLDADGLPWIVPGSIGLWQDQSMTPLTAEQYTLTAEEVTLADGRKTARWTLALNSEGFPSMDVAIMIRFCVQETVRVLTGSGGTRELESNAERVVTRAVLKGSRRLPADFAQRVEQLFALAPGDSELFSPFERIKAVEGTQSFEWTEKEKLFESSDPGEKPQFHVTFAEPLLLGTSRWGVVCGKLPAIGNWSKVVGQWSGKRFLELCLMAGSANYEVYVSSPLAFRLARKEDFDAMHGNTTGAEPSTAEDVKTAGHFYVKRLNNLGSGATHIAAYFTETRWYRLDEWGRLVRDDANAVADLYRSAYPEKAVLVMLRPQDLEGVPLFLERPPTFGTHAYIQIDSVYMNAEGLRLQVTNPTYRENFLGVEVIGYPVSAVQQFWGIANADAATAALYGDEERSEENEYFPNQEFAERAARELVLRRGEEPERYSGEEVLLASLLEDELVWFERDDGTRVLKRVVEVTHEFPVDRKEKKVTRVGVE